MKSHQHERVILSTILYLVTELVLQNTLLHLTGLDVAHEVRSTN